MLVFVRRLQLKNAFLPNCVSFNLRHHQTIHPSQICLRLCERTSIFVNFLSNLVDDDVLEAKYQSFAGFGRVLKDLVNLLREIKDFVVDCRADKNDSMFKNSHQIIVNTALRNAKKKELDSLNHRINDCVERLLPEMTINTETQRQEDFEDMKLQMEEMGTMIVESVQASQKQGFDALTKLLREIKSHCSDDNQALVDRLSWLENKALTNQKILVKDIGGFEEAIMEQSDTVINTLKMELETFESSLTETKQLVVNLKESVDGMAAELLVEIEKKIVSNQSITAKEMYELRQTVHDNNIDMVNLLESKLAAMDMLSNQRDIKVVMEVLNELKQSQDVHDESCLKNLQSIEAKLVSQSMLSTSEMRLLKQQLSGQHEDVLELLELKFDALNMLSMEQDIADIKLDIKDVLLRQDDILKATALILSNLQQQRMQISPNETIKYAQETKGSISTIVWKANDKTIGPAVDLWCTDRNAAIKLYGAISTWDTSSVTDMRALFRNQKEFNDNISNWNVANVIDMTSMFKAASSFNQSLNHWNVAKVTNMDSMFRKASSFNQSLNSWNVDSVTNMAHMFCDCTSFNQPLSDWNVARVTTISEMFKGASSFNQPLTWNVEKMIDMSKLFSGASSFNQRLDSWIVDNITDMSEMFRGASSFNQRLNNWNVEKVIDTSKMFKGASSFNQTLDDWNVDQVTDMSEMFSGASSFNQSLNNWNVEKVTDMSAMFSGASSFNQPLDRWVVGRVATMSEMFKDASSFNQPLSMWNTASVGNLSEMFLAATSFNQPLNAWNVENVTNMSKMFRKATSFNQPLDNWKVNNVTNMCGMFREASSFNQPLNNWNVSSVSNMDGMFQKATKFDRLQYAVWYK